MIGKWPRRSRSIHAPYRIPHAIITVLSDPVAALMFAYAATAHPLRSGGNDVNRNDRAYDKEDYLGKNHEKQLRNMSH